jgi:endoglucanase
MHCWIRLVLAGWAGVAAAGEATPPPAAAVVAVNQIGYLPGGAKWALLWGARGKEARLVDAAGGRTVWQGPLGPAAEWPAAGRLVQTVDFSAFTRPGRYRLQVEGGPASDEFVIGAEAYAALSAAALKAFYFNRAGIELKPEHAGPWARPAGHPDTQVRVHASAAGPGRPEGTLISAPRGWYDAGDYNKYIVNSGISVYTLLAAWEHFPAFFQSQRLNLPESGNGLPDLLNEVLWNLDWMLAMQDPADGGVYHKLTNADFDGMVMPHQATGPRWVVAKSTAAALDFAAVAAIASRVFRAFDAQRPGHAARLLAAARAAWAWAQAHPDVTYRQPPDIRTGEYGDNQLADEFAWAAAELYITTRDDRFWAALKPAQTAMTVPAWAEVQGLGWISLAHHRAGLTAAADPQLIADRVGGLATRLAAAGQAAPERVGLQAGDYHWGSHSAVLNRAMVLIQGYRLTGTRAHLDAAQALLDNVLGRNALALSGVTGFGTRSPRHPHHRPSEADGVAEPVPGFLVGGPNAGQQDARHCPVPYPSTLPALSYLDHSCSYASNEVAINWNAPLVYVSAALQVLTPPVAPPRGEEDR